MASHTLSSVVVHSVSCICKSLRSITDPMDLMDPFDFMELRDLKELLYLAENG